MYPVVWSGLYSAYHLVFVTPLQRLYMQAPEWHGFGGWSSKEPAQICAIMTNTAEGLWREKSDICDDLIEKRFQSICIVFETIFYFYLILKLCQTTYLHWFVYKPVVEEINKQMDKLRQILQEGRCPESRTPESRCPGIRTLKDRTADSLTSDQQKKHISF